MGASGYDPDLLKELHSDLDRKYRRHGLKVEEIWRTFGSDRRVEAMKAGAAEDIVLKDPSDTSLGNVYMFIPEWNLRDIAAAESDLFLQLLKHRATTPLEEQYISGFNGRPGDHEHIMEMMHTRNLRHIDSFRNEYTFFLGDDKYAVSFKTIDEHRDEVLSGFAPAINAGLCVPRSVGELIIARQLHILQILNLMVEDVLYGSPSRVQNKRPKKNPVTSTYAALSNLAIATIRPPKVELSDLVASSLDRKSFFDEYLTLLCTEPVVLVHEVRILFFSKPEHVPDEKGRRLPAYTDKYISSSLLEAIHNTVNSAATWHYIYRLLDLLKDSTNKAYRSTLLQEISSVCHFEYQRAQSTLKRHVSTTSDGSKWFRRVSNSTDNRLIVKGDPGLLTRDNPQLHYLLRLCQPETNASKAVDWMKKLDDLHGSHSLEREKLEERVADSLCDLAVIVGFIQTISSVAPLPPFSRKKGQLFLSKAADLGSELTEIKKGIDLTEFAAPIDNLLESGMAANALRALDQCILDGMGAKVGFLYEDLISDCVSSLQEKNITKEADYTAAATSIPFPPEAPVKPREALLRIRKEKEKTRPAHSSIYEITPPTGEKVEQQTIQDLQQEILVVKRTTVDTFSTLFAKSEARGSVSWAAFESAMVDLGFSAIAEYGSVYTFAPPSNFSVQRSIKLHRPHKSHIEGHRLLFYARRLNKNYGWTAKTFQSS